VCCGKRRRCGAELLGKQCQVKKQHFITEALADGSVDALVDVFAYALAVALLLLLRQLVQSFVREGGESSSCMQQGPRTILPAICVLHHYFCHFRALGTGM